MLEYGNNYDNIHITADKIDCYNKIFNFIQSLRSIGKTTLMARKMIKTFEEEGRCSLLLYSQVIDITESRIADIQSAMNKFRTKEKQVRFYYKASALKEGVVDVYTSSDDLKNKVHPIFRILALSKPTYILKGGVLFNLKYIFMDEYIVNIYAKEKYRDDMVFKFQEIYNTYLRESDYIRCYFFGNIYSHFNPFHEWKGLDMNNMLPGTKQLTDDTFYWNVKPSEQLLEELRKNPLYKNPNDPYTKYALEGIAVNDLNKKVIPTQPKGYRMQYLFKYNNMYIAIYCSTNTTNEFPYWASVVNWNPNNQRQAMCFDFSQLGRGTFMPSRQMILMLMPLKNALMSWSIAYQSVSVSYYLEYIYSFI